MRSLGLVKCAVDCTKLLTGSADNFCKLWEVKTGECLHTWKHTVRGSSARTPADRPLRLHLTTAVPPSDHGCASVPQAPVRSVGFALGDKKFLTVLDNIMGNTATIFVWDLELNNLANHPDCPLLSIQGHQAKINRALWGPLNEQVRVRVRATPTPSPNPNPNPNPNPDPDPDRNPNPNPKQLYSCSDDATIRLWDAKTGKQVRVRVGVRVRVRVRVRVGVRVIPVGRQEGEAGYQP